MSAYYNNFKSTGCVLSIRINKRKLLPTETDTLHGEVKTIS